MKKLNKVAMLFASSARNHRWRTNCDNWKNGSGDLVWKNGTNELCWRDANWAPATAAPGCDGAIACRTCSSPRRSTCSSPAAPCRGSRRSSSPAAGRQKVTYAADAFFDFDKSVLKPEGKAKLDDLVSKVKDINLEVIIAVGHTDSVGSDAYNQKLSVRRSKL